jgi:ferredoxin-like protein FixX
MSTEQFIKIDIERCTGCGRCVQVCPGECFIVKNKKGEIVQLEACLECEACSLVCRPDAIQFSYPKGGTGVAYQWG